MRSGFGRFAQELRARVGMSKSEFARATGIAVARVSNLEFGRTAISDDVVGSYIRILKCDGKDAHQLRKLATFSDVLRKMPDSTGPEAPLQSMLEVFGDKISAKALARIQAILERETGERVEALRFSSNKQVEQTGSSKEVRLRGRPTLQLSRLVEIALLASDVRRDHAPSSVRIDVGVLLEKICSADTVLDYRVVTALPGFMTGAFACLIGDVDGHHLIIEEARYESAMNGVHFARHVICHELGHHYLHAHLLNSRERLILAPQSLARNTSAMMGSDKRIEQVVDSMVEVEAECFATLLLVPWDAFTKGTSAKYLSDDFGEQRGEVERYARYFKQPAVLDAFRAALWKRGEHSHPLFHN